MDCEIFYEELSKKGEYFDKRSKLSREEYFDKIDNSKTLYIGNLSPFTSEEKLYLLFSAIAPVKGIIIGIHKRNFKPCGFGFVEFYDRKSTEKVLHVFDKITIDGKKITLDFDIGFSEGRQFGRGYSGGQVKHEYKKSQDGYKNDKYKKQN
jgi:nuclear cap-binding protein subunit 2